MASRTIVQLVDDLDGKELKDGEGQTISFALGKTQYEIDLSDKNVGKLYDVLKPYTDAARKVGGGRSRATTTQSDVDPKSVRAWASSNGYELSARGRVPADVVAAYRAAGN